MPSIKDRPVHYLDELSSDYRKDLDGATSLASLKAAVSRWEPVAGDAFDKVARMTEVDFKEFQDGLSKERRRRFAGKSWAQRFGAILIPEMLLCIGLMADQFTVPEGTAFIRAVEVGRFKQRRGRFYDVQVKDRRQP